MSKLEDISAQYRECAMVRNTYNSNDEFGPSHANALSDGDEKGKGEKNGSIGSLTDIKTREASVVRNKFNSNDPYDDSNA